MSDILFDLTRRETRTYAHIFQRTLVGYWQKIARLNKNPERAAGFKVLQAPDVPSVLLELGYLSSDRDSRALTSPDWRDKATSAGRHGDRRFLRPAPVPVPARRRLRHCARPSGQSRVGSVTPLKEAARRDRVPAHSGPGRIDTIKVPQLLRIGRAPESVDGSLTAARPRAPVAALPA